MGVGVGVGVRAIACVHACVLVGAAGACKQALRWCGSTGGGYRRGCLNRCDEGLVFSVPLCHSCLPSSLARVIKLRGWRTDGNCGREEL
jgi:hypothetical protein